MKVYKRFILFFSVILMIFLFPVQAMADMGPKPSVTVHLKGIKGTACYGTLLTKSKSTGPFTVSDNDKARYQPGDKNYDIFLKFNEYKDKDGYHFVQFIEDCTKTNSISWGYYPPDDFKILLYFPDEDRFSISDKSYKRYAFNSYYTANVSKAVQEGEPTFSAARRYPFGREIGALAVRIFLTIVIELGIALVFGFRSKRMMVFIAEVNVITQIILNGLLAFVSYKAGALAFLICYFLLEGIVFSIETIAYAYGLNKMSEDYVPMWKTAGYSLTANTASFVAGVWISFLLPAFF